MFARFVLRGMVAIFMAVALLAVADQPALAATITVNSTGDGGDASAGDGVCETVSGNGVCTLRAAIEEANALVGTDTIGFNVPASTDLGCNATTGVCTITPGSQLQTIADPVVIDGYTQPGATPNTAALGDNAQLKIELNGSTGCADGGFAGIGIASGSSTVRGLVINRFIAGVFLDAPGDGNRIEGNFIGTDTAGAAAEGNCWGVQVSSHNNIIGGTTPAARNIISGNLGDLGGPTVTFGVGVVLTCVGHNNQVQGNFIGTDATGSQAVGNLLGVTAQCGAGGSSNNTIGGTASGARNVIAFNGIGVSIFGSNTGDAILSNSIFSNSGLGIDLGFDGVTLNDAGDGDVGANNLQNFPVLTTAVSNAGTVKINGSLNSAPKTSFTLEFFANATCDDGHGEGERLLGRRMLKTDASGNIKFAASFKAVVSPGEFVTATATDPGNNTSEFSECRLVTAK